MVEVNLFRGGTPEFKGWFERGDYAEFKPPFSAPQMPSTPPYNSQADAAFGQGWLTLSFPLIPRVQDTTAHFWMSEGLKHLSSVGDRIYTNWVPMRSIVHILHWEVTRWDSELEGVYLRPIAVRVKFNHDTKEWEYEDNSDYSAMLTSNSVTQFPLGTPADGDTLWAFANNTTPLCTFGHNLLKVSSGSVTTEPMDDYYGAVLLGYEIAEGSDEKIANIWRGNFALYSSFKIEAFVSASQV